MDSLHLGTRFHQFAKAEERGYDHCVVLDHGVNHQWAEHSCKDKLLYICETNGKCSLCKLPKMKYLKFIFKVEFIYFLNKI